MHRARPARICDANRRIFNAGYSGKRESHEEIVIKQLQDATILVTARKPTPFTARLAIVNANQKEISGTKEAGTRVILRLVGR